MLQKTHHRIASECFTGHASKRDSADNRTLSRGDGLDVGDGAFVRGGDEAKAGVGTPAALRTCVAAALVEVGTGISARLKMFENSARMFKVTLSRILNTRPRAMFSFGRRCCR